jgi:3-hydroxyacyl-[acyl-carrier-protein] dehydratase
MKILEIEDIKKVIPHRYPFLLIDRVLNFELGKSAYGIKNVSINEWFFAGHFPSEPIMPGVLIVEALAQLSNIAMCADKALLENPATSSVYFVKINEVTFRKKVVPGDTLHLYAEHDRTLAGNAFFNINAQVNNEKVVEGKIIATIR